MDDETLKHFVASFYEDVTDELKGAEEEPGDVQYQLGVRRLAKAFFEKFELFELGSALPELQARDVDAWFDGQEKP